MIQVCYEERETARMVSEMNVEEKSGKEKRKRGSWMRLEVICELLGVCLDDV